MKIVISDTKTGKAYNMELDASKERVLVGLEVGKTIDAAALGLPGYKISLTGGSDKDGFPIRTDIHGRVKQRVVLGGPPGFRPKEDGLRRGKSVRGKVITHDIVQVNAKVVEAGAKPLAEILGKTPEGQAGSAPEKTGEKKS